ncbi:MAG TPA: GNAT family N-acetyltransferase [Anaerolineales bacterium]|nr:GNAT family N-acetyltransferase [Anaerolineales bacterium]
MDVRVRPALLTDQRQIANLMHFSPTIHRHLDWRYPLDWIGSAPFFVLENQGQITSALACPPDPPSVAWVRLFVNSGELSLAESWQLLWEAARMDLARKGGFTVAAIVLQDWYHSLLINSGFSSRQSIVMLERAGQASVDVTLPSGFSIRGMLQYDLPAVAEVDAAAFEPIWQNSLPSLERAYPQAVLATVAEAGGQVLGYQLSTRNPLGAHLARLAVRPELQGRGVGRALVADLIQQAERRSMYHLTVNTQSDNLTSLALYRKIGFRETGERFPVYQLQVP